jgi:hypothetical protein
VKSPKERSEVLTRVIGATTLALTSAVAEAVLLLVLPPVAAWLSPAANSTAVNETTAEIFERMV